jgi:ankyrin repeat protein/beta-lactamase regulating signal transducer with metallopeptidase domain
MIPDFFSSPLVAAIGWALLHSLWQGTLLAVVLGLLLVLLRQFSSQTRYVIIGLFMALFAATLPLNITRLYEPAPVVPVAIMANEKIYSAPVKSYSSSRPNQVAVPESNLAASIRNKFIPYFEKHLPLLVMLWLMGILALLLRYLGQLIYVQRLKHYGVAPFPAKWQETCARLEKQLQLSKKVKYLESLRVSTPLTIGWLKPVVLFPIGLAARLSPAEVEVILLHELAHIKRNDYFFNVLQSLATILFFYHPATHWMARLLDEERENCCDDLVVELTGQQDQYASTLIYLQEQKFKTMKTALAITGKKSSFSSRIMRLINQSFPSVNRFREGFVTALILVGGLTFLTAASVKTTPVAAPPITLVQASEKESTPAEAAPKFKNKTQEPKEPTASQARAQLTNQSDNDAEKVDLLIKAIDDEDEKLFAYLMKQGVNINGTGSDGQTPLGYAAAEGRLEYVKLLLEKGAKATQRNNDQHTPLEAAAAENHLDVVKLLLDRGIYTDKSAEIKKAFSLAAHEGHLDIVQFLQPLNPKITAEEKVGFLITAIDEDQTELFNFWLKQGADINGTNKDGWTPLGFAAEEGRTKFLKILIDRGAKINYPLDDDRHPFLAAAREGQLDAVEVLVTAGAQVETISEDGTTALGMAAREGQLDVVNYLLTKGAKPNKANNNGWTSLHYSASEGQINVMKRLLAAGANIELPVSTTSHNWNNREGRRIIMRGWTPLMLAIEEQHLESTKALLEARANVNVKVEKTVYTLEGDWQNKNTQAGQLLYTATNWTPLMEAVEKQNLPLVKLLLEKGADKKAQTKEGISARAIAEKLGNKEILQLVQ